MSTPLDTRFRRRARTVRLLSLGIVVAASAGLLGVSPLTGQPAEAAGATDSEMTVTWLNDKSPAAAFQPPRDKLSVHYPEFDNVSISVSQTRGIGDQALDVSVSGFAGTVSAPLYQNGQNFLQAMQCWGPDPLAADFQETCQWGGRFVNNNGLGNSVYIDTTLRVAPIDIDPSNPTTFDNPFRTAQGRSISAKPKEIDPDGSGPLGPEMKYEILDLFNPATTNEVTSARMNTDGTGSFDFETQSADQSPQLGCGSIGLLRCWLVVVPRGTFSGGDGRACSDYPDPANNYEPYQRDRANSFQGGSPINPNCDFWDNRIVVPLDFSPVGNNCPVGTKEQRIIGSQLMVGAMSSWQPDLCAQLGSPFSFSTNPDSVARAQILDGQATMAYLGFPLNAGELDDQEDRQRLAETIVSYAPVAISGVSIAFLAEFDAGRQERLNLTPRLMAKLLTQSYTFTVPYNTSDPAKNFAHLPEANRAYNYLWQDPDFQAANPDNYLEFRQNPAIVLPGPSGADAIRQVWRWMLADTTAAAFLDGKPDQWGMRINPYYLPSGDVGAQVPVFTSAGEYLTNNGVIATKEVGLKNLDGSPMRLSLTNLDSFPKSDQSLVPLKLTNERTRFDSIQFAPYTDNLLSAARTAFRAEPNSKTTWDGSKINASGQSGDWVSNGGQAPGQKFMIAITDTPSAARYGLSNASLAPANSAAFVTPNSASLGAALAALTPTSLVKVTQVDPSKVTGTAYPLTVVTYSAVNLSKSDADSRSRISRMLARVTTAGQVPGTALGQLPAGYVPLTSSMKEQAAISVREIDRFVNPVRSSAGADTPTLATNGPASDSFEPLPTSNLGADDLGAAGADPVVSADPDLSPEGSGRTEDSGAAVVARNGLAVSLGVGLLGSIFGPILFRGRLAL